MVVNQSAQAEFIEEENYNAESQNNNKRVGIQKGDPRRVSGLSISVDGTFDVK